MTPICFKDFSLSTNIVFRSTSNMEKDQSEEAMFCLCLQETPSSVTSISTPTYVPQPINQKSHFIQNRIFVGNIPATVTQRRITDMFRRFGEIIQINIIEDGPSFYAFVTFSSIDAANAVLSLYQRGREFTMDGHELKINRAYFRPKKLNSVSKYDQRVPVVIPQKRVIGRYCQGTTYFQPMPLPFTVPLPRSNLFESQQRYASMPQLSVMPQTKHDSLQPTMPFGTTLNKIPMPPMFNKGHQGQKNPGRNEAFKVLDYSNMQFDNVKTTNLTQNHPETVLHPFAGNLHAGNHLKIGSVLCCNPNCKF